MQHSEMAERDVLAEREREAGIGVQHAAVLDVAILPERDRLVVAAQHGTPPDAGIFAEVDLSYDDRGRRDPERVTVAGHAVIPRA